MLNIELRIIKLKKLYFIFFLDIFNCYNGSLKFYSIIVCYKFKL